MPVPSGRSINDSQIHVGAMGLREPRAPEAASSPNAIFSCQRAKATSYRPPIKLGHCARPSARRATAAVPADRSPLPALQRDLLRVRPCRWRSVRHTGLGSASGSRATHDPRTIQDRSGSPSSTTARGRNPVREFSLAWPISAVDGLEHGMAPRGVTMHVAVLVSPRGCFLRLSRPGTRAEHSPHRPRRLPRAK